ncbi:MAG TPA: undecaprenyl-diphosphate phosphatase [Bacteroidales bacterium]|nr:MAG: Undecaprenyl-diphosphatase [Bacteroidetes bacterium ADurb.Bin217]HPH16343.1 undecaprenyl-diphosphate phosphatase [Bacteroidales bacterium]HPM12110.1 undecaprenyl-diphosphate phosphatase [Bacteroidales bacterium]
MSWIEALIIAIVEGITEFLPVSSTGHMIITQHLLGVENSDFIKIFIVNIQFGAILSVVFLYWKRFLQSIEFYKLLFVAFLPAAIVGFVLGDFIDSMLENIWVVSSSLILGGIVLLFVDTWFARNETQENEPEQPTYKKSFLIGCFQIIAMIPGVSRSAATIIGGLAQGMSRKKAAEFSFFLAVPTMAAASGYKLMKSFLETPDVLSDSGNISILLFGNLVAFIVAMLAIKFFISFLTKYGFKLFGYYRIVVGGILITMLCLGYNLSVV